MIVMSREGIVGKWSLRKYERGADSLNGGDQVTGGIQTGASVRQNWPLPFMVGVSGCRLSKV